MPAEIFLDAVELDVENLETIPFDPSQPPLSYPLPLLRRTHQRRMATLRTAVLENPYVRLTFALDLGGRMVGLFDKRTGIDVMPRLTRLELEESGPRGVRSRAGWQVALDGEDRPNALGPVDFQIREADHDEDPVELWMFELVVGRGLSWHQRIVLAPDKAEFAIELRMMNRELGIHPAAFGWSIGAAGVEMSVRRSNEIVVSFPSRDAGLWIGTDLGMLQPEVTGCGLNLWRWGPQVENFLPREVVAAAITVTPFSGIGAVRDASRAGAFSVQPGRLAIQVTRRMPSQKVVVQTESGQTLEAGVNLDPFHLHEIEPPENILGAALKEQGRDAVLQWEEGASPQTWPIPVRSAIRDVLSTPSSSEQLVLDAFESGTLEESHLAAGLDSPVLGSLARIGLAIRASQAGDKSAESHLLDEALEHVSTDPLLWWQRSLDGRGKTERPELLNAHYLAPLEPTLRAESFLSSPSQEREPSSLVDPIARSPDHLVEVACLLLLTRRFEDASRWIDEALRHRELPMLHLLMAWLLLEGAGLRAEAASHVGRALSTAPEPPFPWRWLERHAIDQLHSEFPDQTALGIWWHLARATAGAQRMKS